MARGAVGRPTRGQFTQLSASFFVSSALGLLLLLLLARWLSPAEYGRFLTAWALVFALGSVLAAVEQEIARQAASAALDHRPVPLGAAQLVAVATAGGAVLLLGLLLSPPGRLVVDGSATIALLVLLSLVGFGAQTLTRGTLLGRHDVGGYVAVIVAESMVRLVALGLLVLAGVRGSVELAVLATVLGCFGWLSVVHRLAGAVDWKGRREGWAPVAGTVMVLGAANGLSALTLTGFPAVATAVLGETEGLATLFAVVTLSRTPLVLLAPVQAMVVPAVVRWVRQGETARLRRALVLVALGALAAALLGGALGWVAGPAVVELLLGEALRPTPALVALVVAATCVMAAALLQAAVLVALERRWQLAACWLLAVVVAAGAMAMLPGDAEQRGTWGFVGASFAAFLATAVVVRVAQPPVEHVAGGTRH